MCPIARPDDRPVQALPRGSGRVRLAVGHPDFISHCLSLAKVSSEGQAQGMVDIAFEQVLDYSP